MDEIVKRLLNGEYSEVCIDSRQVSEGSLFIPIKGEKFNGNSFILSAFKAGAKSSLVSRDYFIQNQNKFKNRDVVVVEDTLIAMQQLAKEYRQASKVKVIGITGSNGKTSTKNLLASILMKQFRTHKTKINHNNEIGLPLTILNMPYDTQIMVLELGMSEMGEIHLLADISRPEIGIITNIGTSHIEFLKTKENILKAKLEITDYFNEDSILVLNGDDSYLSSYDNHAFKVIKTSVKNLQEIQSVQGKYSFLYDDQRFHLDVFGKYQMTNAYISIVVARLLGMNYAEIIQGIEDYHGEMMRFEMKKIYDFYVINDSYNASYLSIKAAVETLLEIQAKRRIVILGDVLELGDCSISEHRRIGKIPELEKVDLVLTIGEYAKNISYEVRSAIHFKDIVKLSKYLSKILKVDDVVLIKASRGMQLERIIKEIEERYEHHID